MSSLWDPLRLDPFVYERSLEHMNGTCRRCDEAHDWQEPGRSQRLCRKHAKPDSPEESA
jgi:hypothetical protein